MVQLSGAEKARTISRMFGRIASRYDTGNRLLSMGRDQGWRRRAVRLLDPQPGQRILDLGAGTGDLSLKIAPSAGSVFALDISGPMVSLGSRKATRAGVAGKVGFMVSDGLRLPFRDSTFDGVATAFTIRNLASIEDGLAEIFRVLKPGGSIAFTDILEGSSMTTPVRERLRQEMTFTELNTLDGYRALLDANGCDLKKTENLTEEWAQVLIKRLAMYRRLKDQTVARFGSSHFEKWDRTYSFFVSLYTSGELGGGRFLARKCG